MLWGDLKVVHTSIEDWHAEVCFSMNVGLAGGMEAVVLWYVFQPMNSTIVQLSNGAIGKNSYITSCTLHSSSTYTGSSLCTVVVAVLLYGELARRHLAAHGDLALPASPSPREHTPSISQPETFVFMSNFTDYTVILNVL